MRACRPPWLRLCRARWVRWRGRGRGIRRVAALSARLAVSATLRLVRPLLATAARLLIRPAGLAEAHGRGVPRGLWKLRLRWRLLHLGPGRLRDLSDQPGRIVHHHRVQHLVPELLTVLVPE